MSAASNTTRDVVGMVDGLHVSHLRDGRGSLLKIGRQGYFKPHRSPSVSTPRFGEI